jgi:hypothetical protein
MASIVREAVIAAPAARCWDALRAVDAARTGGTRCPRRSTAAASLIAEQPPADPTRG